MEPYSLHNISGLTALAIAAAFKPEPLSPVCDALPEVVWLALPVDDDCVVDCDPVVNETVFREVEEEPPVVDVVAEADPDVDAEAGETDVALVDAGDEVPPLVVLIEVVLAAALVVAEAAEEDTPVFVLACDATATEPTDIAADSADAGARGSGDVSP